jgi:hypothetical protein
LPPSRKHHTVPILHRGWLLITLPEAISVHKR